MVMATTDRPIRAAEMGRTEAEQVTQAIKDNFDSLGAMLAMARDRKAYKALGYRSFETYCQTEFGKSISSAYQLIEDAKVLSQLEARISEEYGESITLNFPSSHLKPLKEIDNIDDKLKAIEYANKLAAAENRKATKKDLEIAVFQISGKRSEDFRAAIQGLGFNKGVQVEVFKALNRDRGFVTKIDKGGKIHVEFHYGGNAAIPYDAADLRILSEDEQPAKPLNEDITNKGDRVSIFTPTLKGKKGIIFQWKSGKQALVMVDEINSPIDIAYAEMELLKPEQKDTNWEADLSWDTGKQTYYYFQKEDLIYSNKWPTGLTLSPYSHELSPIDFMLNWEDKFAGELLEGMVTPAKLKTLVLARAIELPEEEGKEFAADLVASLLQLFPQKETNETASLITENEQLREQLAEAESAIQAIVNAAPTASTLASPETSDFLVKNTETAVSTGIEEFRTILQELHLLVENAASTASPLASPETSDFLVGNTAKIRTPGDTAAHTDFLLENTAEISADSEILAAKRQRIEKDLEIRKQELHQTRAEKKIKKLRADISILASQLKDIDDFATFRIGDSVIRKIFPDKKGIVNRLKVSSTGLLTAWVTWQQEHEGESNSGEEHNIGTLIKLSSVDGSEK